MFADPSLPQSKDDETLTPRGDGREFAQTSDPELVEAEMLADAPSPFSFGMQALFALTAVAGVQFALMAYLGVLVGLLVGIGVCALSMIGLIAASVVLGLRPGDRLMDHLDRLAIRLVFGIVVLMFGTMIAGGGQILYKSLERTRFSWKMERDLGFDYREQAMWDGQGVRNTLAVTKVKPGGAFDQAGIQPGDLIVTDQTPLDFLKTLDENRGYTVDITLAPQAIDSTTQSLEDLPQKAVTLRVPK